MNKTNVKAKETFSVIVDGHTMKAGFIPNVVINNLSPHDIYIALCHKINVLYDKEGNSKDINILRASLQALDALEWNYTDKGDKGKYD